MPDDGQDLLRLIGGLEGRILCLEQQRLHLAARIRECEKYIDTITSPLYKRMWWFLCGFHFRKLGRWCR